MHCERTREACGPAGAELHGLHVSVGWKCRGMIRVGRLTNNELKVNQAIAGRHGRTRDPIEHYSQRRRAKFKTGLMN